MAEIGCINELSKYFQGTNRNCVSTNQDIIRNCSVLFPQVNAHSGIKSYVLSKLIQCFYELLKYYQREKDK